MILDSFIISQLTQWTMMSTDSLSDSLRDSLRDSLNDSPTDLP